MNPASKSGRSKKSCQRVLSILDKRKLDFNYKFTRGPEEAVTLAGEAAGKGWDVVVAVGGDGTICEVISGLLKNGPCGRLPKLGVLHTGTSPDFNRYHNIPVNLSEAVEVLIRGKSKLIDAGKITYMKNSWKKNIAYFGSNVNIGLGPLIAGKANSRHRKHLGDFLGTLCALLSSLTAFKGVELKIKIDGEKIASGKLINLTVGKDPYLASGMRVFSGIRPDDGKLYVLPVKKMPVLLFLINIYRLYWGDFLKSKAASIIYGRKIEIEGNVEHTQVEFDGDVRGYLPVKIEVIPKALEVISQ